MDSVQDPYAAERAVAMKKREEQHESRKHSTSLGKRTSREYDEDELGFVMSRSTNGTRRKRSRMDGRTFSARYEGEIEEGSDQKSSRRYH